MLKRYFSNKLLFNIDSTNMVKITYDKALKLNLGSHLDITKKKSLSATLFQNNRDKTINELFKKQPWNIKMFSDKHLPIIAGTINNKYEFEKRNNNNFLWLLDLPIKMPGTNWKIPIELKQFTEFFTKSIEHEKLVNPNINNCYAYLSVDQRPVKPNESQRRPGWHSDSFITRNTRTDISKSNIEMDTIYLTYNSIPTEFCEGPYIFDNTFDHHNNTEVLNHFDKVSFGKEIKTYSPFTILKMGPECIHRVGFNYGKTICQRTFIKLVFSTEIFNRIGNDHSYLFDYNWPLIPRTVERNNSNIITSKDENAYITVSIDELNEAFDSNITYPWTNKQICQAHRYTPVIAYPATEGELLKTGLDDTIMTYNTAKRGDWKVRKLSNCTEYFLSSEKMQQFYEFDFTNKNGELLFKPKPLKITAIQLISPIKIMAPWNHWQYLLSGDFIIKRSKNDIYGISKDNFLNDYRMI